MTAETDARITRVGHLLRRWKLDELPQLVDVLLGSMSLVGPRPEVPAYVELWPEEERREILSVRPGLTDPMTVLLRDEERLLANAIDPQREYVENLVPKKVRGYVSYVRHRSFWGDAMILMSTLRTIIAPAATADESGRFTNSEVV